jgi:hypothetical protein
MMMNRTRAFYASILGLLLSVVIPDGVWASVPMNRNYTYIYFENGYPIRLKGGRQSQGEAHEAARERPEMVIQTGFYSLRFNCKTMQLTGYDALEGSDYLAALNEDVTVFSPAELLLKIEKDGVEYRCTSGVVQDENEQYVRLIESGQYVQRFDHTGLIFKSKDGDVLERVGRFEVTAWPEHVVFNLDLSGVSGVKKTEIRLTSPAGKIHQAAVRGGQAVLMLQPQLDREYKPLDASDYVRSASGFKKGPALHCEFDEAEAGLKIDLPLEEWRFPSGTNRLDEFLIEIKNDSTRAQSIPLIFNEIKAVAITGTSMLLCEEKDGRPVGIPVQVSKNWHNEKENRVVHDGPWLRGYTMIPLQGKETKTFRLRVVTGYWGGIPAVSFSQLCVIGYGGNWKWDESALGCWGESMCYDPSQHLGGAFITDVRPSFVMGKNGKPHEWTENQGGGDFLIYTDRKQVVHRAKKLKTAYHWTGPNMTEVFYSGVTDDDRIRFNYRIRSVRTADYHRRFHAFKYEFLEDVISPQRLVFHQMAADHYISSGFENFYVGDSTGLQSVHTPRPSTQGYFDRPIRFKKAWLMIDDLRAGKGEDPGAYRGLLALSSELNGTPQPVFLHLYCPNGRQVLFDMGFEKRNLSYAAGDRVSAELEFIMPAKCMENYWGQDREFASRLKTIGTNVWQAVADEFRYNVQLEPTVHRGKLIRNYPLEIEAAAGGRILADVEIPRGGIGHLPLILRNVPAGIALCVERFMDGNWIPAEEAWQGIFNPEGTLDCVFNIARPVADLNSGWRFRIIAQQE